MPYPVEFTRREFISVLGVFVSAILASCSRITTGFKGSRKDDFKYPDPEPEPILLPQNTKEFIDSLIEGEGGYWETLVKERREFWFNNPEIQLLTYQRQLSRSEIEELAQNELIVIGMIGTDNGTDPDADLYNRSANNTTRYEANADAPLFVIYNIRTGSLDIMPIERDTLWADLDPINTYTVTASSNKRINGEMNPAENISLAFTIAYGLRPDWTLCANFSAFINLIKTLDKDSNPGEDLKTMRNRDSDEISPLGPGERNRTIANTLLGYARKILQIDFAGDQSLQTKLIMAYAALFTGEGFKSILDKLGLSGSIDLGQNNYHVSNQTNPLLFIIKSLDKSSLSVETQNQFLLNLLDGMRIIQLVKNPAFADLDTEEMRELVAQELMTIFGPDSAQLIERLNSGELRIQPQTRSLRDNSLQQVALRQESLEFLAEKANMPELITAFASLETEKGRQNAYNLLIQAYDLVKQLYPLSENSTIYYRLANIFENILEPHLRYYNFPRVQRLRGSKLINMELPVNEHGRVGPFDPDDTHPQIYNDVVAQHGSNRLRNLLTTFGYPDIFINPNTSDKFPHDPLQQDALQALWRFFSLPRYIFWQYFNGSLPRWYLKR